MAKYREDVLTWDEEFMIFALAAARRSKDPNTQVGACIVDPLNRVKAMGYNGFPRGVSNHVFPWNRKGNVLDTKYVYMCHAEANAIDNRGSNSLEGCKIYVTLYPCNECAKRIIQNGISEVIYLSDKYAKDDVFIASSKMFQAAEVSARQLIVDEEITLKLKSD